ncbi:hypothetical protein [Nitrosomonas sp.]|uniref:DUF7946 domain-containing protein n=1 Tax=Nitrosomonas sp. TaxID=42353 RepID=UPI0025CFB021|nr:hypothetical protein [Nitrosomonas sp.]
MIKIESPVLDQLEENLIVSPMSITYEGNDADRHIINAQALGESIIGASKLYSSVAHYCSFGFIPRGKYKKEFFCFAGVPREGSYEYFLYIAAIAQEYNLHNEAYKASISYIFSKVIGAVKNIWIKRSETEKVVENLTEALREQAQIDSNIQSQLINSLTKANDNLASLHSKLINTIPKLADATRPYGKQLVAPIGNSCRIIKQFENEEFEVVIDEPEAEAIRNGYETEVEDMKSYQCRRITEVNIVTGHCIMQINGFNGLVPGKISDPAISQPNNVYTRALNNNSSFEIFAKIVKRDGAIVRLFVSDARDN